MGDSETQSYLYHLSVLAAEMTAMFPGHDWGGHILRFSRVETKSFFPEVLRVNALLCNRLQVFWVAKYKIRKVLFLSMELDTVTHH